MKRSSFIKNLFGAAAATVVSETVIAKALAVHNGEQKPEQPKETDADADGHIVLRIAKGVRRGDLIATVYGTVYVTQSITAGKYYYFIARHINNSSLPVFKPIETDTNHNAVAISNAVPESSQNPRL